MKVEYDLHLHITGASSMYEASDALNKAAGELLMARILNKGKDTVIPTHEPPPGLKLDKEQK